jgi:hypothetical protein
LRNSVNLLAYPMTKPKGTPAERLAELLRRRTAALAMQRGRKKAAALGLALKHPKAPPSADVAILYPPTQAEREYLTRHQSRACAICGNPPDPARGLVADHCHRSKFVRGLLCNACNAFLGQGGDTLSRFQRKAERAILYLARFERTPHYREHVKTCYFSDPDGE